MKKITFSVVICTKDRPDELRRCVASLLRQSYLPKEVIIVDDHSIAPVSFHDFFNINDGYDDFNENKSKLIEFTVVRNDKILGVVLSRNNGILQANCDVAAFLDDDSFAHRDWLKNLSKNYNCKNIAGVGGPVIEIGREYPIKKGAKQLTAINRNGDVVANFTTTNIKDARELPRRCVRFFRGGNMSFRKNILEEIGGADKNFKGNAYREETDICMRIAKKGKLFFEPEAMTYHKTAMTGGNRERIMSDANKFLYWYFRNTLLLFMKHLGIKDSLKKIYAQMKIQTREIRKNQIKSTRSYLTMKSRFRAFYSMLNGSAAGFIVGIKARMMHTKNMDIGYPEQIKSAKIFIMNGRIVSVRLGNPTLLEIIIENIKKMFTSS